MGRGPWSPQQFCVCHVVVALLGSRRVILSNASSVATAKFKLWCSLPADPRVQGTLSTSLFLLAQQEGVQLHGCIPPQAPAAPPALSSSWLCFRGKSRRASCAGAGGETALHIHQPTPQKNRSLCHPLAPHSGGSGPP